MTAAMPPGELEAMRMNNCSTINTQRIAVAIGAVLCLIVILAMFTALPNSRPIPQPLASALPAVQQPAAPHFTLGLVFGLFVVGLIAGTFGGMLGMGGGVIKMSCLLLFFGFHPGLSRVAALLSYFIVAIGAAYRYYKAGLVMNDVVKTLIPASIVGLVLGAIVGHHLSADVMVFLLGMFLLFTFIIVAKQILSYSLKQSPASAGSAGARRASAPAKWKVALSGLPGGFLCSILGISGGVVTTPLQQVLAKIPIKNAIANTLFKAVVTVPIACLIILILGSKAGHFEMWHPILVGLCLIPGSIIGSQLGPMLTTAMSQNAVRVIFGALTLSLGLYMLFLA